MFYHFILFVNGTISLPEILLLLLLLSDELPEVSDIYVVVAHGLLLTPLQQSVPLGAAVFNLQRVQRVLALACDGQTYIITIGTVYSALFLCSRYNTFSLIVFISFKEIGTS